MTNRQTITIAIVAWPRSKERLEYFRGTIAAIKDNAIYSRHDFNWVCSAECKGTLGQANQFEGFCRDHNIRMAWKLAPPDIGANMNAALRMATGDFILLMEDDWILKEPVDLSDYAELLRDFPEQAMVRFAWQDKATLLAGTFSDVSGIKLLEVNPLSDYFYGNQPHLRRASFASEFGWYKEGCGFAGPELDMNDRLKKSGLDIVTSERCLFEHCGDVPSVSESERNA